MSDNHSVLRQNKTPLAGDVEVNDSLPPPPPPRRQPVSPSQSTSNENDSCDPQWKSILDDSEEDPTEEASPPLFEAPRLPYISGDALNVVSFLEGNVLEKSSDVVSKPDSHTINNNNINRFDGLNNQSTTGPFISHHPIYVARYKQSVEEPSKFSCVRGENLPEASLSQVPNRIITHHPLYVAPFTEELCIKSRDHISIPAKRSNKHNFEIPKLNINESLKNLGQIPTNSCQSSNLPNAPIISTKSETFLSSDNFQEDSLTEKILDKFSSLSLRIAGQQTNKMIDVDSVKQQARAIFRIFLVEYNNVMRDGPVNVHPELDQSSMQYQIAKKLVNLCVTLKLKSVGHFHLLKKCENEEYVWEEVLNHLQIISNNFENRSLEDNIHYLEEEFLSKNIYEWIAKNGGWNAVLHLEPKREWSTKSIVGLGGLAAALSISVILLSRLMMK